MGKALSEQSRRPGWLFDAVGPSVLYGLRLASSVTITLLLAFQFQLDEPWWAGGSAAIVCQPVLGAALRKSLFRIVGTLIGATVSVAMTAAFPQDRIGFVLCLALWCALCCFVGTRLTRFAGYAAILSGYTASIIAASVLLDPTHVFEIAIDRASNVVLGIVVATSVLTLTQPRHARLQLATELRSLATLALDHLATDDRKVADLIQRLAVAQVLMDDVQGEAGYRMLPAGLLRAALDGLFAAFAELGTRTGPPDQATQARLSALGVVPDPAEVRACRADADESVQRVLVGVAAALAVSDWIRHSPPPHPGSPLPDPVLSFVLPADPIPALLNATRSFACIVLMSMIWIETRWTAGPSAIVFSSITVLVLSLLGDATLKAGREFIIGTGVAVIAAGIFRFAVLPQTVNPAGLVISLMAVLAPVAAISTAARASIAVPFILNFLPILAPTNIANYDTSAFYNSAAAILLGCVSGVCFLWLIPSMPKSRLDQRIVAAAERDLVAIRAGRWCPDEAAWRGRMRIRATGVAAGAGQPLESILSDFVVGRALLVAEAGP